MQGKFIIVSGPVIIEDNKLLVNKDDKDNFYKLPGGRVEQGETLEETCHREILEENNSKIKIIKPLHPKVLWENPQTKEKMAIILISYQAKLLNKEEIKPIPPTQEIRWLDLKKIDK